MHEKTTVIEHKEPVVEHPKAKKEEVVELKNCKAKVMDIETDGKNLFLEIDLTDGMTTLKLEPVFPHGTGADAIISYLKELIEHHPTLTPELQNLVGLSLIWDSVDESWYELRDGSKRIRIKNKGEKGYVESQHEKVETKSYVKV